MLYVIMAGLVLVAIGIAVLTVERTEDNAQRVQKMLQEHNK